MGSYEYSPSFISEALLRGRTSDLRQACDLADRIVEAVVGLNEEETLEPGFTTYRARKDYIEHYSDSGNLSFFPLEGDEVCAPPKEKTLLGRFNAPLNPTLYLSTSPEFAIAEIRALSTDTCTVATFESRQQLRVAKLLEKGGFPMGWLNVNPTSEDLEKALLYETASFVSRRIGVFDHLGEEVRREVGVDGFGQRVPARDGWVEQYIVGNVEVALGIKNTDTGMGIL